MSHYNYCDCGFGWDDAVEAGNHVCDEYRGIDM
jgi:hypothetical protein